MNRSSILSLLVLASLAAACGDPGAAGESATTSDTALSYSVEPAYEPYAPPVSVPSGAPASAPMTEPVVAPVSDAVSEPAPVAAPESGTAAGTDGGYAANASPAQVATSAPSTQAAAAPEAGMVPGMAAVSLNPMLVRTGRAMLQVDSLEAGIARVQALARRVGGLVGNANITAGTEETRRAEMELRIPSVNFDEALASLAGIGKVESVNVSAEDVGEEYTDVSARVANARRVEGRILEMIESRNGQLDEVLNLEREVARVRGEIEQYEGRLRYLRSRSSVSLLTITLHEPQTVLGSPPGERPIRDALLTAWYSFVRLLAGTISTFGVLIPLAFMGYVAWRVFRRFQKAEDARQTAYRENLRRERAAAAAAAPPPAPPAASAPATPAASAPPSTSAVPEPEEEAVGAP